MTVSVLWPFLIEPWVGLQCVIVAFPGHAHLLFDFVFLQEDVHNLPEVMAAFYLHNCILKMCV